ncbi:MAG: TIGR00297 family protein [Methanosarcinales archaeon]|nr:TIGR00297 family protein [Methanosarcinales archaeon]
MYKNNEFDREYLRQIVHILIGLIVLIFPFIDVHNLIGLFVILLLFVASRSSNTPLIGCLFRKCGEMRRPEGAINLSISILILLSIHYILTFTQYELPLYIIGSAIAIGTFGDGAASMMRTYQEQSGQNQYGRGQPEKEQTDAFMQSTNNGSNEYAKSASVNISLTLLIVGTVFAFLAGSWIVRFGNTASGYQMPGYQMIFVISAIGAVCGALLETISIDIHDNMTMPLGSAMIMWLFTNIEHTYSITPLYIGIAIVFAFILGFLAYRVGVSDISGILSATLVGALIIAFTSIWWFVLLLAFYALGGLFTKYKYAYKKARGVAEKKGGARGYRNVFSNSVVAVALAVAYPMFNADNLIIFAYLGAVATAAGDTLASEIGITSTARPYMITTLKRIETGVDGGITVLGEGASLLGASTIGILAVLLGIIDPAANIFIGFIIVAISGFAGTNIDSYLGATLQRRGMLTNNGVNLVSTMAGALMAAVLYLIL